MCSLIFRERNENKKRAAFFSAARGRYNSQLGRGRRSGLNLSPVIYARYCWGIIKRSERFQVLRVERLARAAVQASPVGFIFLRKRAAQAFVPAAEDRAENSDFFAEGVVRPIDDRVRDVVLFQNNCLHLSFSL